MPPTSPSSSSNSTPWRRANQSMTRRTSRITSGPMPSPGSSSTLPSGVGSLRSIAISGHLAIEPGLGRLLRGLEVVDPLGLLHGEPDVVEPVHEAVLAERVDLEGEYLVAGRPVDLLLFQVDGEGRILGLARLAR